MSSIAHIWRRRHLNLSRLSSKHTFQRASYASKAPRPKSRPQKPNPNPHRPETNESASIQPHRTPPPAPPKLAHDPTRQAAKPSEEPGEIKRWHVRQQIGYKGVAWRITQLIVGIPVVIVFGYHLYGRVFLGWEQKQAVTTTEDGKEVFEPIRFVGRDKPEA